MLQRAYMRWAESHGYGVELLDESPGEEAGIKSTTFSVTGPTRTATCVAKPAHTG